MPTRYYANAPATSLDTSCTALATSIVVVSATGLPITYPYTLIIDRGLATEEVVEVTNASGTTLTVTRGADSTTAWAHAAAAEVVHGITARDLRESRDHEDATVAHGTTGDIVGTTDTQTLTNKTFDNTSPSVFLPPGLVMGYGGLSSNIPAGWLICQGQAVSRITYADLYAVLGNAYGSGDGSTTFNLPDLRDAFPMGAFDNFDLGVSGGATGVVLSTANMPSHSHTAGSLATASTGNHTHTVVTQATTGDGGATARGSGAFESTATSSSDGAHTHNITGSTASAGSGSSFSIIPPYQAVHYIIKT